MHFNHIYTIIIKQKKSFITHTQVHVHFNLGYKFHCYEYPFFSNEEKRDLNDVSL